MTTLSKYTLPTKNENLPFNKVIFFLDFVHGSQNFLGLEFPPYTYA